MKEKIILLLLVLAFTACEKDYESQRVVYEKKSMLEFSNEKELLKVIKNEVAYNPSEIPNFKSLMAKNSISKSDSLNRSKYENDGYDTLVPNENLAKLLNEDAEIKVGKYIYRISNAGTFYYTPDKALRFNDLFNNKENLQGVLITDKLYRVEEGIFRYDTFLENYSCENGTILESKNDDFSNVPFDSFKTFNADPHTWEGKGWAALFGENISYKVELNSNRRLKGKFYSYDYVFYSEIGVFGEMQKKNWIGWSGTEADELGIGWRYVRLKVDLSFDITKHIPKDLPPQFLGSAYTEIPGLDDKGWNVCVLGYDVSDEEIFRVAKLGLKPLVNYLNSITRTGAITEDKLNAVTVFNKASIITIVPMGGRKRFNAETIREVFNSDIHGGISLNLYNIPGSLTEWANALYQGTAKLPRPELTNGEVFVYGRLGSKYVGMKIVKD